MRTLIVGSGPGGATLARELARAGESVHLVEGGRDWRKSRMYGTYPGVLRYAEGGGLNFTEGGLNLVRPLMLGGATSMYCGCSAPPGEWWQGRYGIDLREEAADAAAELGVAPLPAELRGAMSTRLAEAGMELGMDWRPQEKFMSPGRAERFDCGARCMLGCRCGAKWNAAEWVDDAVAAGAQLWTETKIERVRVEGGAVAGAIGTRDGKPVEIPADRVIVAGGGVGSAALLRRSGIEGAGRGIAMDTTAMVYGLGGEGRQGDEPPMTWSSADDELGVLYSTLIDPWLMYPLIMATKGPRWPLTWHRWGRTLGVMIKLKDDVSGSVAADGRVTKGMTAADRAKLDAAEKVAGAMLRTAGCDPGTIFTTPLRATHPSASCRIGSVVDKNLSTEIDGLYVCDSSVFPEALARPTVLTIIALARRLAKELLGR